MRKRRHDEEPAVDPKDDEQCERDEEAEELRLNADRQEVREELHDDATDERTVVSVPTHAHAEAPGTV
jgi:hypothetical protein